VIYLDAIRPQTDLAAREGFPFALPVVRDLTALSFSTPVTLLVGENGSGKSTILEAIAAGLAAVAVGSADIARDPTLAPARALAKALVFVRRRYPKHKLFFRAEDAFGFAKRVIGEVRDLETEESALRAAFKEGSYAQRLATGVARGQRAALVARYGENPDGASHGESFLRLLQARLHPKGLYLLDEPETPLSPLRILALMALMKRLVDQDCQFVIATHSPILMAFPGARILLFEGGAITEADYEELEHVTITRAFLADPRRFLNEL
jgi:predicted ATPase